MPRPARLSAVLRSTFWFGTAPSTCARCRGLGSSLSRNSLVACLGRPPCLGPGGPRVALPLLPYGHRRSRWTITVLHMSLQSGRVLLLCWEGSESVMATVSRSRRRAVWRAWKPRSALGPIYIVRPAPAWASAHGLWPCSVWFARPGGFSPAHRPHFSDPVFCLALAGSSHVVLDERLFSPAWLRLPRPGPGGGGLLINQGTAWERAQGGGGEPMSRSPEGCWW